ncbi:hypothetical protein [Idiomarina sp. OXR-189]|jgi:uncharacterized protein (DUF983 family)|uniref:hypothetical protein n=1 Tax=Idiomarina sp. OXR-189 TaxID=3100175 RepID=UPI000A622A73|nr:hypothetical protein [Idiomarina sp. OXR-189]WPZ01346.1 hypothetical protein UM402_00125 [Idiomarina sp. OXR-189]|tara:strand:+ start:1593 stop:1766 length:174 start_codon:yes stop_codon:yes gene_type:complete
MKKDTLGSIVILVGLILSGTATLNLYYEIPLWVLMFVVILGLLVFIYVFLKSKGQED